jgi:carboxyl-terminal processing protease
MENPMNTQNTAESGRQLYHAIWATAGALFFDVPRLAAWDSWEHRCDDQIVDDESAIGFAREMLAALDDPYTRLTVVQPPADTDAAAAKKDKPSNVLATLSPSNIGYLRILSFMDENVTEEVTEAAKRLADAGCNGLILDLRYNPGGNRDAAVNCCELFLRSGVLATIEERRPDGLFRRRISLTPEVCVWEDELPDGSTARETYKRLPPVLAGKPLVILISATTASASETLAIAVIVNGFKDMVMSVGATSLGKGLAQTDDIDILGKVKLRVSCGRNLGPCDEWLGEGKGDPDGIEPDIAVADAFSVEALEIGAQQIRRMIDELKALFSSASTGDQEGA